MESKTYKISRRDLSQISEDLILFGNSYLDVDSQRNARRVANMADKRGKGKKIHLILEV